MSNNQIEHHLRKALVSNNEASKVTADDTIVLASAMTSVHKTLLIIFLLALVAIAVASQARIDIVVSVRGELLLESDVEKVQHLEGGILEELLVRKGKSSMRANLSLEYAHSTVTLNLIRSILKLFR